MRIKYPKHPSGCINHNLNTMKTIKDFQTLLHKDGQNTFLGMHLNYIINQSLSDMDKPAHIHDFELKVEVIVQMHKNGIDAFTDRFPMGSVSKAYYQHMLNQYNEY